MNDDYKTLKRRVVLTGKEINDIAKFLSKKFQNDCSPSQPKEATEQALLFSDYVNKLGLCELEMERRHCEDEYKLVKVKLEVIEE